MVYVNVKEDTPEKLHLSREPGLTSWAMVAGFASLGFGAAYYGNDHCIWKMIYVTFGILIGLSCLDDWEDCVFDKTTGDVRLKKHSAWDIILTPFTAKDSVIVSRLPEIVGVRVEEEKVNYFGTSHQVVLLFSTGMALGVTETFTFGSTREHYDVAEKIRTFLGLDSQDFMHDAVDDDNSSGDDDGSADDEGEDTADDFEQIDKSEIVQEMESSEVKKETEDCVDEKSM